MMSPYIILMRASSVYMSFDKHLYISTRCYKLFLGYSPKFTFFLVKKKSKRNKTKRLVIWKKLAEEGPRYIQKNQVGILDEIWSLIIPQCTQVMWTSWSRGHATHNQDWDLISKSRNRSDRSVTQWKPAPRHQHYWNE
jgi:hypothetical protein